MVFFLFRMIWMMMSRSEEETREPTVRLERMDEDDEEDAAWNAARRSDAGNDAGARDRDEILNRHISLLLVLTRCVVMRHAA